MTSAALLLLLAVASPAQAVKADSAPAESAEELETRIQKILDDTRTPGIPHYIRTDVVKLRQVLINLLSNAITFSPPGGIIRLTAKRLLEQVRITVEDQGPGMPEGKLEAIFDRFYSERPKSEKFGTHSGLGLSISRQIIEAHGGSLQAENIAGPDGGVAGARFVILLPVSMESYD